MAHPVEHHLNHRALPGVVSPRLGQGGEREAIGGAGAVLGNPGEAERRGGGELVGGKRIG